MLLAVLFGFGKLSNVGLQVERVKLASKISLGILDLAITSVCFALDVLKALLSFLSLKSLLIVALERKAPTCGYRGFEIV